MTHLERNARRKEIETRLKEITIRIGECEEDKPEKREDVETPEEQPVEEQVIEEAAELSLEELQMLEEEVEKLIEEEEALKAEDAAEEEARSRVAAGLGTVKRSMKKESERSMENEKTLYRSAWLNKIRGIELTEMEKRAYSNTVGNGAEVVPIELQNEIIAKVRTIAPMVGEIRMLHAKGGIRFAVQGVNNAASIHSENAEITAANDTFIQVILGGYEITKLVVASDTVRSMSIEAFAAFVVDELAKQLAQQIEYYILKGSGVNEPTGIDKANTWVDNTNQVTVASNASLTAANVMKLVGMLKQGYAPNAKFVMNRQTFFNDFMPLQKNNETHIVSTEDGENYKIYRYPVLLTDYIDDHIAYFGDMSYIAGNMAEDITIHDFYDIYHNNYVYSGVGIFDCKPMLGEAFVKLNKAS